MRKYLILLILLLIPSLGYSCTIWEISGGSGNWNATGNWSLTNGGASSGTTPGTTDDVCFSNLSGNMTLNVSTSISSLDMTQGTGYTGTFTHNSSITLTLNGTGANLLFKLSSGMTYTLGSATTSALNFTGTSGNFAITTNGKTVGNITFNGTGGTWTLQDNLNDNSTVNPNNILTVTAGNFDANGQNIRFGQVILSGSTTRTITLGAGVWWITSGVATPWNNATTTNETLNTTGSTIVLMGSLGTSTITFAGGGKTYDNLDIVGAGIGTSGGLPSKVAITGTNTFTTISIHGPRVIIFPHGVTTTITGQRITGDPGAIVYLQSDSAGLAATLSLGNGGNQCMDYLNVQDMTFAGTSTTWYAGANSTNVSGNSGITFSACPAAASGMPASRIFTGR